MSAIGDLSPQAGIALGILVGLVSTSVQSLGLTLQRKSHILEDDKAPEEYRRPPYRRRRWQLGMLMFIVSNIAGSSVQITTLPLPVLSTLQASGLVFNSICATLILGEPFTRWSLAGTVLVCGGAVLIAIFGAIGEPAHSLTQLLALLERPQFIIWLVGTMIIVLLIIGTAKGVKYVRPHTKNQPLMRLFRGMSYGAASGILSAHSLLVAKSAVELVVRTVVDGNNQFTHWQAWVILLSLLALALSQLYYLHRGLRLCSTSILYPFVFCIYNIIAILDGLIYFDQTNQLSLLHALLVALGTIILLTGVLALSWRLNVEPARTVAQNPLAPGLGLVNEEASETESLLTSPPISDEEVNLTNKESSYAIDDTSDNEPPPKLDTLLTPKRRRRGTTEREEILEELADDVPSPLSPYQTHPRKSSLISRSNPASKRNSRARFDLPAPPEEHYDEREEAIGRRSTSSLLTDSTPLLRRAETGRMYRTQYPHHRRRSITSIDSKTRSRRGRSASSQSQDAVGGWWKMQWWRGERSDRSRVKGKGKGKGKGREGDEEGRRSVSAGVGDARRGSA